jgi:hypothetical protein
MSRNCLMLFETVDAAAGEGSCGGRCPISLMASQTHQGVCNSACICLVFCGILSPGSLLPYKWQQRQHSGLLSAL